MSQEGGNPDNNIGLELLVNPKRKISRDAISTMSSGSDRDGGDKRSKGVISDSRSAASERGGGGGGARSEYDDDDAMSSRSVPHSFRDHRRQQGGGWERASHSVVSHRSNNRGDDDARSRHSEGPPPFSSYGREDEDDDPPLDDRASIADSEGSYGAPPARSRRESDRSSARASSSQFRPRPPRYMSEQEVTRAKQDILNQFERLERKGYALPRKFTMSTPLDEMKAEYERLKHDREVDNSVQFQRNVLMTCVMGVEYMNEQFDPFDVRLNGWSVNVNDSLMDYDDIFEELHAKYGGTSKMAPELRLLFMLGGSAVMHHMNSKMFSTAPPPKKRQQQQQQQQQQGGMAAGGGGGGGMMGGLGGLASMMGSMFGGGGGGGNASGGGMMSGFASGGGPGAGGNGSQPRASAPPRPSTSAASGGGNMRGPNVDDLLRELQQNAIKDDNDRIEVVSTVTESDVEELKGEEVGSLFGGGDSNSAAKDAQQSPVVTTNSSGNGGRGNGRGGRGGGRGRKTLVV